MSGSEDRGPISPGLTGPAPRSARTASPARLPGGALRQVLQSACRTDAFASRNLRTEPCPCVVGFASPLQTASRRC